MTHLVPIQPGQWVLAYVYVYGPDPFDRDLRRALERLIHGGSGWDCLSRPEDQFEVLEVDRVMPKTFSTREGGRRSRYLVVAAGSNAGEMLVLRDKLFTIGFAADRAIEEETARRMAEFIAETETEAIAKVHAALPHIFGRAV